MKKRKPFSSYLSFILLFIFFSLQIIVFIFFRKSFDKSSITDWIQVEIILLTSIFIFTLYKNTSPHFKTEIIPEWENKEAGVLKIKFACKNMSKITVPIKLSDIRIAVVKYRWEPREFDTYFPFEVGDMADRDGEFLINSDITSYGGQSSGIFYSEEEYSFERVILVPPTTIVKIGVRITVKLSWIARISHLSFKKQTERWTKRIIFLNV